MNKKTKSTKPNNKTENTAKESWATKPIIVLIVAPLIVALIVIFYKPIEITFVRWYEKNFPPEQLPLVTKARLTRLGSEKNFIPPNSKDKVRVYISRSMVKNTGNIPFQITSVYPYLVKENMPELKLTDGDVMDDFPTNFIKPGESVEIKSVARIPETFLEYGKLAKQQWEIKPEVKKSNPNLKIYMSFPVVTEVKLLDWNEKKFTARIESVFIDHEGNEMMAIDSPESVEFK